MTHPGPPQSPYGYPQQQPPTQQPAYGYPSQQGYGYPPQQPGYGYPPQQPAGMPYAQQQPWAPDGAQPPYAGWMQRAGAFLLDALINFGPFWVLTGIGAGIEESSGESGEVLANVVSWIGVLAMIAAVVYQLRREGRTGQTVGKKALGIRAVRERDGRMLGFGLALGRRLLQFLNYAIVGLGWWWAIWDIRHQTFADKIASVIVLRADAPHAPQPAGPYQ
ncbi:RDD family protein [Streptomyces sp. Ru73]|uniref:RDD family protein n=1 Tax=Streptomyces sp. Ru73 TaxID=2080748 RepID=UPI00215609E6|nr:RDD family protein [Streptomyces sp. Ru73]